MKLGMWRFRVGDKVRITKMMRDYFVDHGVGVVVSLNPNWVSDTQGEGSYIVKWDDVDRLMDYEGSDLERATTTADDTPQRDERDG